MEEGTKRKKTEEKTVTENKESYAQNTTKDLPRAVLPDSILTNDVDAHVESFQEKEDARWHSILNAHRTRKILSGTLSGIETLESGWW